jgi:hypothetical protein
VSRLFAACGRTASEDELLAYAKAWKDLEKGEINDAIDVAVNESVSGDYVPSAGAVRQIAIDSRVGDRIPKYCERCQGTGFITEKHKVKAGLPYKEANRVFPCECMPVAQRENFRTWESKFRRAFLD